jgi:hypothetical protein
MNKKNKPYIALSESHIYEEEKVILYQHILLDEQENIDIYRFWTHFFSQSGLFGFILIAVISEVTKCD